MKRIVSKISEKAFIELTDQDTYCLHGTWEDWHPYGIYRVVKIEHGIEKLMFFSFGESRELAESYAKNVIDNTKLVIRKRIENLNDYSKNEYEKFYNQVKAEQK
jgi:hypothetical protein